MKISSKWGILLIVMLLFTLPLLAACDDDETTEPTADETAVVTGEPTAPPVKDVTIKIGLLTDKTGPAAQALIAVDAGMADVVRHFNENNLIPGVKLEVIEYDTAYDPSKDIPGYEFLKSKGADVICNGVPSAAITCKPRAEEDHMVMFSLTAAMPMYTPPGYVFCTDTPADALIYTTLDWLVENDPNYPADRPAKIGALGGEGPYAETIHAGVRAYVDAHPDQYELDEMALVSWQTVDYSNEVAKLLDCDYLVPPSTGKDIPAFMKQYRSAGGEARFLGTAAQIAYLGMLVQGAGYDVMDGMVFSVSYTWWNEEGESIDRVKQFLNDYHSEGEAATLKASGGAYRGGAGQWYGVCDIIAETINDVGIENFSSEALYDHAVGFEAEYDGNPWVYSADPEALPADQRTCWTHLGIHEMDAEIQELSRLSDGWIPVLMTP